MKYRIQISVGFGLWLVGLLLIACGSCAPQPLPAPIVPVPPIEIDAGPPPIPVDAGPQPDLDPGVRSACAAITAAGCPEGGPKCGPSMQKALVEQITFVPLGCLAGVRSKSDVHACGRFVACP